MAQIRRGTLADAEAGIDTICRSIAELCHADHRGDPEALSAWLSNKTAADWSTWIARDDAIVLVAAQDQRVTGVGMVTRRGHILLNYVHPEARFSGISKALLAALEAEVLAQGVHRITLESTVTARDFYTRAGYRADDPDGTSLSKRF